MPHPRRALNTFRRGRWLDRSLKDSHTMLSLKWDLEGPEGEEP